MNLVGEWGAQLIRPLLDASPTTTVALLSGLLSPEAVADAFRAGARHVFNKVDDVIAMVDEVERGASAHEHREYKLDPALAQVVWRHIAEVLAVCAGNKTEAAKMLGVRRQGLQQRLKKDPPARAKAAIKNRGRNA